MARLRNLVLANIAGQAWAGLMALAFVPLYLRTLGAERFGIVALMLTLQALATVLDLGASAFLSRELARRAHDQARRGSIRTLVRSFEWLVWPVAALIGALVFVLAAPIVHGWLRTTSLPETEAVEALRIVALVVALLWPTSFYNAGLQGIEQQPRQNVLLAVFATLRYAGVLVFLKATGSGLAGFLWWHAGTAAAQTACTAWAFWRRLPPATTPPRFDADELRAAWRFALGLSAITAMSLLVTQVDRLALTALRPLAELGVYAVALSVSAGLGRCVQPVLNGIYPRLARQATGHDDGATRALYLLSSEVVAVIVGAIAAVICVHSREVLLLWTGDAALADTLRWPLVFVVAGTAISSLSQVPYLLQLAFGWTRLPLAAMAVVTALSVPGYVVAVRAWGITGAALVWLGLNALYALITIPWMHRRLLRGDGTRWLLAGVLPPVAAAAATSLLLAYVVPAPARDAGALAWIAVVGVVPLAAATLAAAGPRRWLQAQLSRPATTP